MSKASCLLCGRELSDGDRQAGFSGSVCHRCVMSYGQDRVTTLLRTRGMSRDEHLRAVAVLRKRFTSNQIIRIREFIAVGGRNWWLKVGRLGDHVCAILREEGFDWDDDVFDEIWDHLVEEAVTDE